MKSSHLKSLKKTQNPINSHKPSATQLHIQDGVFLCLGPQQRTLVTQDFHLNCLLILYRSENSPLQRRDRRKRKVSIHKILHTKRLGSNRVPKEKKTGNPPSSKIACYGGIFFLSLPLACQRCYLKKKKKQTPRYNMVQQTSLHISLACCQYLLD